MLKKLIPEIAKSIKINSNLKPNSNCFMISEEEKIRKNLSAIKIQKIVNGKNVTQSKCENRNNKFEKKNFRLSEEEEKKMKNLKAKIIQSAYRNYSIEKMRIGLISNQERKKRNSELIVNRALVSYFRRKSAWRKKNEILNDSEYDEFYQLRNNSATIIQSTFRGESVSESLLQLSVCVCVCVINSKAKY